MAKQRWSSGTYGLILLCLAGLTENVSGTTVREYSSRREAGIAKTSGTYLADELPQENKSTQDRDAMAVVPSVKKRRELPPTSKTAVSAVNNEKLKVVNNLRMFMDIGKIQHGKNVALFMEKAIKLRVPRQVMTKIKTSIMSNLPCIACNGFVGILQIFFAAGLSNEWIMSSVYEVCNYLKLRTQPVCQGDTNILGPEVLYILRQVNMSPKEICSFVVRDGCGDDFSRLQNWEIVFPSIPKPPIQPPMPPKDGAVNLKILHISDNHYDPHYQEGSNAACNEPLCCRQENGPPSNASDAAGRWGDYRNCDTPKRTIDHMLKHISDTHFDIDYILWTGDLPPHEERNQSREENLKIIRHSVDQMKETFPGVPIFPAVGNHESVPVNSFPPPFVPEEYSISWLYDELDREWKQWLPNVTQTVRRGAFYSVPVRPGFRVISVNTMYCYFYNWWLLINSTDPVSELEWLVNELQGAESRGEKVHIIGHIPPGHPDCIEVWSRNYYKIINRYESTITAQFFGHTHFDEFQVFYDTLDLKRALSIAYIGPSVTPFHHLNPGYRIYYVDGDHEDTTRLVTDHETWVMNLREANLNDNPIWEKLYSARQAYQMPSLLPRDWDSFIEKISNERSNFDLYYKHYYKNSPVRLPCNNDCRMRLLCDMRSGESHAREILCRQS